MAFGYKRTKKTEVVKQEESLGYTHEYSMGGDDKGSTWARPLYIPAFRELGTHHMQARTWLR